MAIFSYTLAQLIEKLHYQMTGYWKSGTATDGSTTTVEDTDRRETDDYFQNTIPASRFYIVTTTDTAAPSGEEATASDWVQSTGTVTVAPAYSVAPGAGDTYCILSEYTWEEMANAINMAIDIVAEDALVWSVDTTTITLVAATYEYNLPTTMMYVYRFTMGDADDGFDDQPAIPPDQWSIVHSSTPMVHFGLFPYYQRHSGHPYGELWAETDLTADRKIRIEGIATPATLSTNTATSSISPAYLVYQAAALLHESRAIDNDSDLHRVRAELCQKRADIERARVVGVQLPPNARRVRE